MRVRDGLKKLNNYESTLFPLERRNVENKNNSTDNIRFANKTSDIRNFSQNIKSNVKTSKAVTLLWSKSHTNSFLFVSMVKYTVLSEMSERLAVVAPRGERLRESFSFTSTLYHLWRHHFRFYYIPIPISTKMAHLSAKTNWNCFVTIK